MALAGVLTTLVVIALRSEGTYDGGDGVQHYLIARYAFSHPELLFDLWGKPVFTLFASPFAQFGLQGMYFFNIVCGALSSVLAFRIAQRLELKQAWTLPIFICFSPIFFGVMNSGLAEPLFVCALMFAIALAFDQHYAWAAVVASFLMFIRPEANFVLPVFVVFFLLKKKYLHILFLSAGFVIYSIIGYFRFHDILWVINRTPYNDANAGIYGDEKGELFHYFINYKDIVGLPLAILFISGTVFAAIRLMPGIKRVFHSEQRMKFLVEEYVLLYGCLFSIIIGHSLLWGLGIFPTLGMFRYLSSMIPMFAILCLAGLNMLVFFFGRIWFAKFVVAAVWAGWLITLPFKQYYYPFVLNPEEAVIAEAADWLNANQKYEKIYYMHPCVATRFDVDPFDTAKVNQMWMIDPTQPGSNIASGSIIVWDAHFGPNECKLPLDTLKNCPDYELLRTFNPAEPFTVLGGYPFQVCLFRKK